MATAALVPLLTAGAHAEPFPAVRTNTLPSKPAAPIAIPPQGKPRLASPGIPFAGLNILPRDGISRLYTNQGGYGTLNSLDTPTMQAVFHLKNETDKPITLDHFQPSCHCTTATVEGASAGAALPTIPPGESVAIRVRVDLAGHPSGNLEKSVSVYVTGHAPPAAVLAMEGVLEPRGPADSYEEALWLTVSGLSDRDTTCAMVGGIVALSAGAASIPEAWITSREPLPRWPFQEQSEI